MQGATLRYLILAALLSAGALAFSAVPRPLAPPPSWPADEEFFAVGGWSSPPALSERINDTQIITRDYLAGGASARLVLKTGTSAKTIYRAGPEVPFVGSGFSVTPVPTGAVAGLNGAGGLLAERGEEYYV